MASISVIAAIISPVFYALMNITDKYAISHKAKNTFSFAFLAGMMSLIAGLVLALFLDWSALALKDLIFPLVAGVIAGSQYYTYYFLMKKADASSIVGFIYFYPVVVLALSFFFLNEVLSPVSYVGSAFILLGTVMLSIRAKKLKFGIAVWTVALLIIIVGVYEFLIKVVTTRLPELNGLAVNCIAVGVMMLPWLFIRQCRQNVMPELQNIRWVMLTETFTFLGLFTLYFAMSGLPATVVSSIAATQPLIVVLLEKLFHISGMGISKEERLLPKMVPISMIVLGVIILYWQVLV